MGKFSEYIGSQFGNPRGLVGRCCCIVMNVINKALYRKTVALVRLNGKSKALDIGYGNGYLIQKLYKKYRPFICGIDISEDMRAAAEKRNAAAINDGKLRLSVGDCCELEYEDGAFDAVTSVNTVYFWNDTLKGMREILRVLKQGGRFYNAVYAREWLQRVSYTRKGFKMFEREDYVSLGRQAGFKEIEIIDISKGKSFVVVYTK